MNVSKKTIVRKIRRAVKVHGIDYTLLQKKSGLSPRTIGRLKTGMRDEESPYCPSYETVLKLDKALSRMCPDYSA